MKAIILAAGEGKRLRPLTKNIPKCMVELFGKSMLQRQVETYRDCGITNPSVVTGYHSEAIQIPNVKFYKNKKFNSTNMVESLFCAKNELKDSVIVSYGDIIFEKNVLEKLIKSKEDFSVIIDKNWKRYWRARLENPLEDAESLSLDRDGFLQSIGQKVSSIDQIKGQYIGLMKFQNEGLKFLKDFYQKTKNEAKKSGKNPLNPNLTFEKSFMTDLLQGLINVGCKLKAVPIRNGWLELDSIQDYKLYTKMYNDKTLSKFIRLVEN